MRKRTLDLFTGLSASFEGMIGQNSLASLLEPRLKEGWNDRVSKFGVDRLFHRLR
jgi:hypothetical protein